MALCKDGEMEVAGKCYKSFENTFDYSGSSADKKKKKKGDGKFLENLPGILAGLGGVAGAIWGKKQETTNNNYYEDPATSNKEQDKEDRTKFWIVIGIVLVILGVVFGVLKYTQSIKNGKK